MQRSRDAVMDEHIHAACVFGRNVLGDIKVFDLACDLAGDITGVEAGNGGDTTLAGQEIGPATAHIVADRGHMAQAGHYYSAF
ncbi:hypothetical protein D3C71_1895620 [compost metagenome]